MRSEFSEGYRMGLRVVVLNVRRQIRIATGRDKGVLRNLERDLIEDVPGMRSSVRDLAKDEQDAARAAEQRGAV
jgi:hypothetical protein